MKELRTVLSFALITFFIASTAQISKGPLWTGKQPNLLLSNQQWLASQIYSAAFNDISPGFDDLYIIKTQDKDREIVIYCNTNYCYKNRNAILTS